MWKRNLLFVTLCLVGFGWIGANLLKRDRIKPPKQFSPGRLEQDDLRTVVDRVNAEFREHWKMESLEAAGRADDYTIARRLTLGLAGTIPSLEELRKHEKVKIEDRVEWWTSRLLEDRRCSDHLAERLARNYVGVENGPFIVYRRRRFTTWLSERLFENDMHYDQIVRALISDSGLWTDHPAVNFVSVTYDADGTKKPDPVRLAARTSRAFLGLRIDCLQCHDDKLSKIALGSPLHPRDGLQSDFHQLAAFYSDVQNTALGFRDVLPKPGDNSNLYKVKFQGKSDEAVVAPSVPYAAEQWNARGSKRQQLARWVTHSDNKPFARTAVNRYWAFIFGRPLVEPIDDIPLYGPFPPGLETLAEDFAKHNFDLHRLVRVLTALEVFQIDSRADFEITDRHENAFAVFPLSRLRPEQFAGSVLQAAMLKTIDAHSHIIFRLAKFGQQNDFVKLYGDIGEDEFTNRGGTIPQRLLVMNGRLVQERTKSDDLFNASGRIASFAPTDAKAVETAYLSILTRLPTSSELEAFTKRLDGARGKDRKRRMEDLCWMLMNSSEFAWNH